MREIFLTNGATALVDDEDLEFLSGFNWYAHSQLQQRGAYLTYARTNIADRRPGREGKGRGVLMHRMLLDGEQIDHVDGNGLNNTRANLRPVTRGQNRANCKSYVGKSQFRGVSPRCESKTPKWKAYIRVDGKLIMLGTFSNEVEAARAYNAAAIEHFGAEYAYQNPV